jgi:dTDP-4-amino-4,6-dideoxygalactose transaminase
MGMIKIPDVSLEFFKSNQDRIFSSGSLAEGRWNDDLSKLAREICDVDFALPVNSNGAGLHAILRILKEYYGKQKVFIQANTMYGVKTIAQTSGLKFIGSVVCTMDYLMPTLQEVRKFVAQIENPDDTVFLLTHIGGWVNPDIEAIVALCGEHGITVVEDCAHSFGSTLNGRHSGTFGVAGVYSFYATKAVPVGEGGLIV